MRELIMDLTAIFFGIFMIINNLVLFVPVVFGNDIPLGFCMVVLGAAAMLALVNRVLAWTDPCR